MITQIEKRISKRLIKHNYKGDPKYTTLLISDWGDLVTDLSKIITNNDWLEYPKHKPSEKGNYVCTLMTDGREIVEIGFCHINNNNTYFAFSDEEQNDLQVIAFKPIQLEPFQPKNNYVETLKDLINLHWNGNNKTTAECCIIEELIIKIENGDLK